MLAAVEWRFAPDMSIVLQYLGSQSAFQGPGAFSNVSNELTLGWKGEIQQGTILEIGLIENFILFDNSPDFGFHAGLTWRF